MVFDILMTDNSEFALVCFIWNDLDICTVPGCLVKARPCWFTISLKAIVQGYFAPGTFQVNE